MMRANAISGFVFASVLLTLPVAAQEAAPAVNSPAANAPAAETEAPKPQLRDITQEMKLPKIMAATVDWNGARDALARPLPAGETKPDDNKKADGAVLLARINTAANTTFKDIAKSSVPVLLPVSTDAVLRGKAETLPPPEGDAAGFKPHFFFAGAAGYDAAFTLAGTITSEIKGFAKKEDPVILISGFAFTYDLDAPTVKEQAALPRQVKELEADYPGIRRRLLENYVRYSFEKYGTPYVVSMLCHDGRAHQRWVICKEADVIIQRFLKSLQIAGGTQQETASAPPNNIDRPSATSSDFTFAAPGRLIENTGLNGLDGRNDWTVYAKIRFPLNAPAFANSQSFLNWGNCDFTGTTLRRQKKDAVYHCKVNDKQLVFNESAPENRAYPWRDNFCEHRRYFVGQCPGGEGHQGQDIRPATCKLFNDGADRCMPFNDEVVAVRDGMILRVPQRESLYLLVNAPGEHVRFRYLHMHPGQLDEAGLVSGRTVKEGETLGKVGNYDRVANGTTYHVHFELQVPTRDGWVFVSPYATLISSYERLIGGRGREFVDPPATPKPAPEAVAEKTPAKPVKAAKAVKHAKPARAAKVAAKPNVRPSAADGAAPAPAIINPFSALSGGEAKKETPGDKKAAPKSRRTAADCKTAASGGNGDRACQPRAAKQRTGANGV